MIGIVWQHTLTPQHPFDGFQVHAITVPCFGRKHNIIKGCSWVSTGNEAIARSRFQHPGIRYVASQRDLSYLAHLDERNPYDDDAQIARMSHAHYADDALFEVANWPQRVAQLAVAKSSRFDKALDVTAVDFTVRLIGVGYRMQENGAVEWTLPEEAAPHRAEAAQLRLDLATFQKVRFLQAGAQNLLIVLIMAAASNKYFKHTRAVAVACTPRV